MERDRGAVGACAEGMKKMVWSATGVDGGRPNTLKLPHPPQVDGTFQNFQVPAGARPTAR